MKSTRPPLSNLPQRKLYSLLKNEFDEKRARNPRFSLRAYAKLLGLSAATLSRIFNGRRSISKKAAAHLMRRLQVDKPLLAASLNTENSDQQPSEVSFTQLDADQIALLSDWYHFAVLSLAETRGFKSEIAWISERLGITKTEAEAAVRRLERLQLLDRTAQGKLRASGRQFTTTDRVRNLGVRRTNRQFLQLASDVLDKLDDTAWFVASDFSGMTMVADPRRIIEANRRIRIFRRRLCAYLEGGEKKEVYRLAIQLFPLTQQRESL